MIRYLFKPAYSRVEVLAFTALSAFLTAHGFTLQSISVSLIVMGLTAIINEGVRKSKLGGWE